MNTPRLMIGTDPARPGSDAWAVIIAQLAAGPNIELLHEVYQIPSDGPLLEPAAHSWEEEYAGIWEQIMRTPLVRNGTEWVSDTEAMELDILRFAKAYAHSADYRLYDRRRVKRARRRAYRRKVLASTISSVFRKHLPELVACVW